MTEAAIEIVPLSTEQVESQGWEGSRIKLADAPLGRAGVGGERAAENAGRADGRSHLGGRSSCFVP
jgi:hypothetical protein